MAFSTSADQVVGSNTTVAAADQRSLEGEHFIDRHRIAADTDKQSLPEMGEVDYESLPTDKLWAHLLAGGVAGITEHCVMYPVDCVKTRMMTLVPNPRAQYRSLFSAFRTILATERPHVLFRGMNIVAIGAGPAHSLYFSAYEISKRRLSRSYNNIIAQGVAAALATLVHDGCMNPIEVIKQRLQMYNTPYKGVIHCFLTVSRQEGISAFYRSYTTQLSMNIPFQVLHFIGYEFLQDQFNPTRVYNPLSHMLSGAGAGAVAAAFTTPLDVAKTLLNTLEQNKLMSKDERLYGMVNALIKIYRIKGIRGYFNGLTARVLFQMPSTALCWSVYELFKYALGLKATECTSQPATPVVDSSYRR